VPNADNLYYAHRSAEEQLTCGKKSDGICLAGEDFTQFVPSDPAMKLSQKSSMHLWRWHLDDRQFQALSDILGLVGPSSIRSRCC